MMIVADYWHIFNSYALRPFTRFLAHLQFKSKSIQRYIKLAINHTHSVELLWPISNTHAVKTG